MANPQQPSLRTDMERMTESLINAAREAVHYFEKFDRSCLHASAYHRHCDWLLGDFEQPPPQEQFLHPFPILPNNQIVDLILGFKVQNVNTATPMKYPNLTQLHHIIREMTIGMYIFQQTPQLSFSANHDGSTTVNVTPAYYNTLTGQTLISLGYAVVALLNRFEFEVDKRTWFADNWRTVLKQSQTSTHLSRQDSQTVTSKEELIRRTFEEKGLVLLPTEPTYVDGNTRMEEERTRLLEGGLLNLDELKLPNRNNPPDFAVSEEQARKQTFLLHLDSLIPHLVGRLESVKIENDVIVSSADVDVGVKHTQQDNLSEVDHRRIHCYLQAQREYLCQQLFSDPKYTMDIILFKYIVFLLPLFTVLKRQGKIPYSPSLTEKLEKDAYSTEKDLGPILPSAGSRWFPQKVTNLCGFKCDIDIFKQGKEMEKLSEEDYISSEVLSQLPSLLEKEAMNKKVYHIESVNGESYYFLKLSLEDFYGVSPKIPRWVHAFKDELRNKGDALKSSDRFSESKIQDILKLKLGFKEMSQHKTNPAQLRKITELGELIGFYTLAKRSTKTYMQRPGPDGNNLFHLACLHGKVHIAVSLMQMGCDLNQPTEVNSSEGTCALSLAAGSGHIDIVAYLVTHGVDARRVDYKGWIPLHYAAYNNNHYIVRYLVHRNPNSLNQLTGDANRCSPLLLSIQAGALDTVKELLRLGASIEPKVQSKLTLVQWTALNCHINILNYLIDLKREDIPVCDTLTKMLRSDSQQEVECAARMLDPLSKCSLGCFQDLQEAGGVEAIISLLDKGEQLQYLGTLVLQNISHQPLVKRALSSPNVITQLAALLSSKGGGEKLQWRVLVILSDIVTPSTDDDDDDDDTVDTSVFEENKNSIHAHGAITHIVPILTSSLYDLRLNACYCLSQVARLHHKCQREIVKMGALPRLVSLLQDQPHDIKVAAALAIASIVEENVENQMAVLEVGAVDCLVNLLFSDIALVHNSAAHAIENIASQNQQCQNIILANGKSKGGLARLLKMKENQTKICGLFALYAIAGAKLDTKKVIANFITIPMLADMIELGDRKLELVCADALNSLATGQSKNASRIQREGGVLPVFRTLQKAIREVMYKHGVFELIRERILHLSDTLYSLLLGQALVRNAEIQEAFYENNNVHSLVNLSSVEDQLLRAKSWLCLAAYMRDNHRAYRSVKKGVIFNFDQNGQQMDIGDLLDLFKSEVCSARVIAIFSLALFVYNNKQFEKSLTRIYTLSLCHSEFSLLKEEFETSSSGCDVIFSQIILAAHFQDISSSDAIIDGIKELICKLASQDELIVIGALNYLAALARTDCGIPATIIAANGIEHFFNNLFNPANSIARMAAVALGYLTFNPTGRRNIITAFRLDPYLCFMFNKHFTEGEVCRSFKYDWEMTSTKGLPALSLDEEVLLRKYESNFVPPPKEALRNKFIASNLHSRSGNESPNTDTKRVKAKSNSKANAKARVSNGPLMQRKLSMLREGKPAARGTTIASSKRYNDSFEDTNIVF